MNGFNASAYYAIIKNERGMYLANDRGKVFFPDRSWKGARPGVVKNVHVTVDKETYGFIRADMVEIEEFTAKEYINKFSKFENVELKSELKLFRCDDTCENKNKENEQLYNMSIEIDRVSCEILLRFKTGGVFKRLLYNYLENQPIARMADWMFSEAVNSYANDICKKSRYAVSYKNDFNEALTLLRAKKLSTNEERINAVIRVLGSELGDMETLKNVSIINNMFITVNVDYKYSGDKISTTYYIDSVDSSVIRCIIDISKYSKNMCIKIDVKEINDILIKNCVFNSHTSFMIDNNDKDNIVKYAKVPIMDSTVSVAGIEFSKFLIDVTSNKEVQDELEKSRENLMSIRKQIGKYCTKETISELKKLSDKELYGLNA